MNASPPPAPIPTRVGFQYFGLDRVGGLDRSRIGTVSVYVPDEFPEVKLELYAVNLSPRPRRVTERVAFRYHNGAVARL